MKRLLIFTALALTAIGINAQHISEQAAMERALQYMNSGNISAIASRMAAPGRGGSMELESAPVGATSIYAFNISPAHAQWRAGVTMGRAWNHYSIDKHYLTDWDFEGKWGFTIGATGQYSFNDWLAVRADFNWTQKNHRQYRHILYYTDYDTRNDYLQLPVMASFSFGGKQVRGFLNLGVYGGYWLKSKIEGTYYECYTRLVYYLDEDVEFYSERDQRWDAGLVGGIGVEYAFAKHWAAQVEARCYYSTTSIQKDYMLIKDPKYNTTIGLQAAIYYIF